MMSKERNEDSISSTNSNTLDLEKNKVSSDDEFLVTFDGYDDKEDVRHLPLARKWMVAVIISTTSLCVTCVSSCWSLASEHIMEHFGVSHEVSTLGISFFIVGLGLGGMFLSPISEFHGRKATYVGGLFFCLCFQILTAFSNNIGGMLFGRFMSGFFGSSFMAVASGTFSDLFLKDEITYPLIMYTLSPFIGPGLGPLISGFVNTYLDFRWTFYITVIWTGVMLILVILFVPESYQPVLLQKKAKRLRKEKNEPRYYAPLDVTEQNLFSTILLSSKRPFMLLFGDRMTGILCLYTGFTLAVTYMFFVAFPYIFRTQYHFSLQDQGLTFLGLIIGMSLCVLLSPTFQKQHQRLIEQNNGVDKPEFKFIPLLYGVFVIPIGLFILAWSCYPNAHWIGPIIGSGIYGAGVTLVFNGIFGYTVEAYRLYTASAMATNSFTRSVLAGAFPLFALQMYEGIGVHWATTILALFACLLIPIPFYFYKYGEELRKKSKYTWSD